MPFSVELKNRLVVDIPFCADFGQSVETESGRHAAPNPFQVQKWDGRKWNTQLLGSDVGSGETAVSIEVHGTRQFLLQLNEPGRYRLKLAYTSDDTECPIVRLR